MTDRRITGRLRRLAPPAGAALRTLSVLCALALGSCSEDPTEANALHANLPLANLVVRDTTILSRGTSTYRRYIPLDGRINLIGQTGNYTALAPIEFYPSYFVLNDTARVDSAKLKLHFVTWFGDSTGRLAFNVYRITRGWSQTRLTWDTVQAGFYESMVRGTSVTGAARDTQDVFIALDTAMVRQWLLTPTSTTDTKYGFILVPSAGCSIVRGFTAFDSDSLRSQPTLEVYTRSPTDPSRYNAGLDTFVGNIDNLNQNPQLIYMQAGVGYRATMDFDVSFIPRGAIINIATLQLQRDPSTSRFTRFTGDTAFSVQASLSPSDPTLLDGVLSTGRRVAGTANTFSADARRPVQLWLQGSNYGLTLRSSQADEYSSFDLMTFFNEQASDTLKRPRLKIIYSTQR